jgi:hypothetical protein
MNPSILNYASTLRQTVSDTDMSDICRDRLNLLLDRADDWLSDSINPLTAKEAYYLERIQNVPFPEGCDGTDVSQCVCERGSICMRKKLWLDYAGTSDEDLVNHDIPAVTGVLNESDTEVRRIQEASDIFDSINLSLEVLAELEESNG